MEGVDINLKSGIILDDIPNNPNGLGDGKYLSEKFRTTVKERRYPFEKFLEIIGRNSEGRIYIIGSFVSQSIVTALHEERPEIYKKPLEPSEIDIDFLVEGQAPDTEIYFPRGWKVKITGHKSLAFSRKMQGRDYRLDLSDINYFDPMKLRGLVPSLENFFLIAPLNVQSLAYDLKEKIVIGETGIKAIKDRVIRVHNLATAKDKARNEGVSLERFVEQKAEELGFESDFSGIR